MNIEHMTDRNSTVGNQIGVTDMFDLQLQQSRVADHIADLAREGSAIRAERERDHRREHAATGTDATDHRADLVPGRVRLGRWLVAFGEAIAGSTLPTMTAPRSMAASGAGDDDCADHGDHLATAA
jgi:hypothetical protein